MSKEEYRYISFRVTAAEHEYITQAAAKEKQSLAQLARECTLGIAEIIVEDPLFSIAPCEACGHTNGKELPKGTT